MSDFKKWLEEQHPGQSGSVLDDWKPSAKDQEYIAKLQAELARVKAERDAAVRRYKELSGAPSDFQVIEHQAEVIDRLRAALERIAGNVGMSLEDVRIGAPDTLTATLRHIAREALGKSNE